MNESNHTPGPWTAQIEKMANGETMFTGRIFAGPVRVASAHSDVGQPWEDNALLIAAAPDLLRELQEFVDRWSKYPIPPTGQQLDVYLDSARAVIAAARGGTS